MRCLVALPAVAVPGHRSHRDLRPRRRRTLVALLGGCRCGRRHLLGASSAAGLLHLANPPCLAAPPIDPDVMLERVHPARPGWYEKLYATAMDKGMASYEAEIAEYKLNLFSQLSAAGKNILELGVGTGPNLKYYARADGVNIIGVDPNMYMEEYSRAAAISTGLPSSNFTFRRGVGEALPAEDSSMDAVIGTLVMCSVKDTDMALRVYLLASPIQVKALHFQYEMRASNSVFNWIERLTIYQTKRTYVADAKAAEKEGQLFDGNRKVLQRQLSLLKQTCHWKLKNKIRCLKSTELKG